MEEMPVIPTANSSSSSNSNKAMEKSLQKAILLLAQKSSSIDEKMISLRTVTNYLQATPDISLYNTKSLNQLVMDTILRIIMNENQITNMRKRQLVRTELFVLLGTILTSDTLFGNIRSQIEFVPEEMDDHKASNENSRPISRDKIDIDVEEDFISGLLTSVETQRANSAEARTTGVSYSNSVGIANPLNNNVAINQRAALLSRSVILDSGGNTQNLLDKNFSKSTALQNDRSTPSKLRKLGDATSRSINSSNGFLMTDSIASTPSKRPEDSLPALKKSLIKNALRLNRKISKKLQPRPSVLFNEAVPLDGIVPGVDPMNYFEQDRKLGYQKPRMWFPTARAEINNSLVPSERKKSGPESASNRIVQEYMQMRALISYVGDLVQPFPVKRTKTLNDSNSTSNSNKNGNRDLSIPSSASRPERSIRRLQGVTDSQLFNSALTDAMKLWSPLVGINLPKWNKAEDAMFQKFTAPSSPKRSYSIKKATTSYTEDSSDSDSNEDEGELTLALSSKK